MKSYKFVQQIKSYYKSLSISSYRFWLTIIGMTISVIVLFVGITVLDSYTNSFYASYEEFKDDVIYVRDENGFDDENIYFFNNNLKSEQLTYYSPYYITQEVVSNRSVPYIIRGASSNFVNNYLPENNSTMIVNGHPMINQRTWFEGKTWTQDDINLKKRCIIINYFGASFLFGNENPINKYIEINGFQYKIIGVLANAASTNRQIVDINKQLNLDNEAEINYPYIEIYMPLTTFINYFDTLDKPTDLILKLSDLDNKHSIITNLQHYYGNEIEEDTVNVTYREIIDSDIEDSVADIMPTILGVFIFVFVISGMITMNTLFFNIKEKIPEIGIRKAMGASRINILTQIVFEGVLYALFSFVLGLLIFVIFYIIGQIVFLFKSNVLFEITINFIHLAIISVIYILESAFVSIIPARYASHMKIVDAVRFE